MPRRPFREPRICERCNGSYVANYLEQRYCNRSCAAQGPRPNRKRRMAMAKVCPCGAKFTPAQPRIKFCSRRCVASLGGTERILVCPNCGSEFTTRSGNQVFCSNSCSRRNRVVRRVSRCQRCGREVRSADARRRFCGKECAYASARERRGDRSVSWRGGRSVSKTYGYVWRRAEGHPRTKPGWPYVLEHILVMEEAVGRYLLPFERVHHRNGVRDDNRPENLELWKIKDPAGIRSIDYHCAGCV